MHQKVTLSDVTTPNNEYPTWSLPEKAKISYTVPAIRDVSFKALIAAEKTKVPLLECRNPSALITSVRGPQTLWDE